MPNPGEKDEALLKRIRQRYSYGMDRWRRVRNEGQENMRYIAGDPWTAAEKEARADRPTVCADELNQYVNQIVNTARQNPRGVKVDPAGGGATEKLAEYRENRIRAIEYACNASQAYINALQAAVERNIGYWKVSRKYVSDDSNEQEIFILPVPNPDAILIDPDFKELDGSDIKWAFELDRIPVEEFENEYPDAEKKSFQAEDFGADSSAWYDSKSILIASYWETTANPTSKTGRRSVRQYVTNGIEIIKKGAVQPGIYIPIVPVFGKQIWVDFGGGTAERFLLSLVSLARDPQKALAYTLSNMMENVGQIPKASYIGFVGQFETDADAWQTVNKQYHPTLQVDPIIDAASGQLLPIPQRVQISPDFQSYAIGADLCRRAIMAAMGINPAPTAVQRQNQKSGKALEKIQSEQAIGSYHLVDAYDQGIKLTGRIISDLLPNIDLGEGERPVRQADGKHQLVPINSDGPMRRIKGTDGNSTFLPANEAPQDGAVVIDDHQYHFPIADDQGRYQVTISSGPSHESQREEGSEFISSILPNIEQLPPPGTPAAKILALGIKIKQLGPLGDQMADILDPPNQTAQQQSQMAHLQQQSQLQAEQMQKMQAELQKLQLERAGKVIQMQGEAQKQALQHQFDMTEADKDRLTKLAVAEIETKAQVQTERTADIAELNQQFHDQAHDAAMQSVQQSHEQQMGQQQAAAQSQQSSQEAAQQAAMQQSASPAQGQE